MLGGNAYKYCKRNTVSPTSSNNLYSNSKEFQTDVRQLLAIMTVNPNTYCKRLEVSLVL